MRLAFLILAVSAGVLGYEIALMRALSVARWHHFAYMIVSVALLGFGASGTLLSLFRRAFLRHAETALTVLAASFAVAIPVSFTLAQAVPFDVFQLVWDWWQFVYLFEYYLLLFVPFLLGALVIGLALVHRAEQTHRLYFWNLIGSGVGSCAMLGLMFVVPPAALPMGAFGAAALGAVVYGLGHRRRGLWTAAAVAGAAVVFGLVAPLRLNVSERKQLSDLLREPGARVVDRRYGPLGLVHVVDSPTVRLTSGVSVAYLGELPTQRALVVDADSASAINHVTDPGQLLALDHTTGALPYHLLERPRTLIVGAGGGSDVLLAQFHRCPSVTALEVDPSVAGLLRGSQAEFAQRLFERPGVELVVAEARGFLARAVRPFDLIQLPLVESFGASSAGVHALSESYLYTVEAFGACLDRLTPHGIVCVTRWVKTPPSDSLRIFATLTEALARRGIRDAGRHVAFIRHWSTATVLASPSPWTSAQAAALRRFCDERSFDLVWVPGMSVGEANQCHQLPEPYFARAAAALLSAEREAFLRDYAFDITPATDDRPYHGLSVRWRALRHLRATMGEQWVSYVDWGYLVLLATVVQAAAAGLVLVVLPLFFLRQGGGARGGRATTCVYFACLGVAYMLIELVMMQKLALFLASPIYAAALVLTVFMVCSGLGSRAAGRWAARGRRTALLGVAGILAVGLGLWLGMDALLGRLAGAAWPLRVAAAAACAGPLAFFMGMPFPSGLRRVAARRPHLAPWAWGVNGCASVAGAALTPVLSVSFGFRAVQLVALGLYAIAGLVSAAEGTAPNASAAPPRG